MPVSKSNIRLGVENEQADAGRDGRTYNSRDKIMSSFDKSTSLLKMMTTQTYKYIHKIVRLLRRVEAVWV